MSDPNTRVEPGWYPDPYGQAPLRWWDGSKWEANVSGGAPGTPPVAYAPARRPLAPETPVYTVWIWLVVLLPLVNVVLLLVANPFAGMVDFMRNIEASQGTTVPNPLSMYGPGFFITSFAGWVVYAGMIVFSWLDYRELVRRGVDRPFHWAWTFLSSAVYVIGRGVIVRRVAPRRGLVPIWVMIAVSGISLIVTGTLVAGLMSSIIQSVPGSGVGA